MVTVRDRGEVALSLSHLEEMRRFRSSYCDAAIYRHKQLGRVLVLDGEIQHVEKWVPLYHEPLVHLPAAFLPAPATALLLGGGSFFAAKELLRYRSIERVVMLERDSILIDEICDVYEHAREARQDTRLDLRIGDAFETLSTMEEQFDLVINDAVDLLGGSTGDGFRSLGTALRKGGICSDVMYRHIFECDVGRRTISAIASRFRIALALLFVPEYPGVLHMLTLWSKQSRLNQRATKSHNKEQLLWSAKPHLNPCAYFDPRFLSYYLHLPQYVRQQFDESDATETFS